MSQLGVAIPGFLAGILLVVVFAVGLGWLPSNGWTPPGEDFGTPCAGWSFPLPPWLPCREPS